MKQSVEVKIEGIQIKNVTLKGITVSASAEYTAEEMQTEGNVFSQVIETLAEKFSWLLPLLKKRIEIDVHNSELLSKDLEKQIAEGTTRAYGPRGWSIRTSDLHHENHDKHCDKCKKKH